MCVCVCISKKKRRHVLSFLCVCVCLWWPPFFCVCPHSPNTEGFIYYGALTVWLVSDGDAPSQSVLLESRKMSHRNSQNQDFYIFSRESRTKPWVATVTGWAGRSPSYIKWWWCFDLYPLFETDSPATSDPPLRNKLHSFMGGCWYPIDGFRKSGKK